MLSEKEKADIELQYDQIINLCLRCQNEEGRALIRKAFDLGNQAHENMRRKSGEPYFTHPIAVAKIVAGEIGLGTKSIVCALLHDVVEDTDYTIEDIRKLFGDTIANIIDGLTKISNVLDKDASLQAENFRKMLLTISEDIRVVFIKLADRLHNMRTLDSMPEYKQVKIAGETVYLYAPLAHRLGLYNIKTELEDLALKYEHPLIYNIIEKKVKDSELERNKYIESFIAPIEKKLKSNRIRASITGRPKSIYSIWRKMDKKNVEFEEIYDIFAIRIVFEIDEKIDEKVQCWTIYSLITDIYQPNENRIRDWVTKPKANGYEALHLTVMGNEGSWVEVQIRSERMDEIAEKGYAAHWRYKNHDNSESQLDNWLETVKDHLKSSTDDALDFLDEFKMNLFASEIYIFTPKGKLVRMPNGATAIDFAYDIHTEVGNHAIAAKVNHDLRPLSQELKSGDQVEIITSEQSEPKRDWLKFAVTSRAKSKIKNALKDKRRINIEKGQKMFIDKIREMKYPLDHETFKQLRIRYDSINKEEFYRRIGYGVIQLDDIEKQLPRKKRTTLSNFWRLSFKKSKPIEQKSIDKSKAFVLEENEYESNYTLATCCNPIPGDDVMGFVNANNSVIIHKKICPHAINLMAKQGDRIVTVMWQTHKLLSFLARIKVEGIDKIGMVNNITHIISSEANVNMKSVSFNTNDGVFYGDIQLYVRDKDDLEQLINKIIRIKGVNQVTRIEENE
jgi:GTP diphosphokinase / guanosine-3',5'-bis(diphosphate) 3'-diphosphatase